ncbi:MAG: hypothetical protein ABF497_05465 [Sporolactobacillus sp.]
MKPLYKRVKIDTAVLAQALDNTSSSGAFFDLSHYRKALIVLEVGAMADTKTATVSLKQASTSAGTDAKAIDGATATITAAGAKTSARALLEIDASDLDINNGFGYISVTVATTDTTTVSATLIRGDGRFEPEDDSDALTAI